MINSLQESEIHYVRFSRNQLGGEPEKKEKRWDRDASGSRWLPLAQMLVLVARSYDQDGKSENWIPSDVGNRGRELAGFPTPKRRKLGRWSSRHKSNAGGKVF